MPGIVYYSLIIAIVLIAVSFLRGVGSLTPNH